MSVSLTLIVLMAVMYACGVYAMLERSLSRILIGFLLIGNATNLLLIIVAGPPGEAPIVEDGVTSDQMADPLPQALTLTAIVITFGITALLLALIYRNWRLSRQEHTEEHTAVPGSDLHADDETAMLVRQAAGDDAALHQAIDASDANDSRDDVSDADDDSSTASAQNRHDRQRGHR
ncbi:NADH-quinone oxidoreductase subunit K [Pseudoclavibacter sp. CFCC 11306]|uniref:NADH-quinone oxidoreductase subunit K n=1 Tax=Pseudoclavibacter sp. CFCC 11306 TaxID=1564493 RepID=UPI00130136A6|nr:NADH-quinone oxidoreductase subunit K [Pseudoclavibacter sp. CFCC 11306]KAB1658269.1 Na(+)/H(+) antiporter subunit C [Pseudoclavibacter sp. CFCC 11306]